jgi:hypothetical protein
MQGDAEKYARSPSGAFAQTGADESELHRVEGDLVSQRAIDAVRAGRSIRIRIRRELSRDEIEKEERREAIHFLREFGLY